MKKDELYGKIEQLPTILGWQGHGAKVMIAKDIVLGLIDQLDQPQKVVIPQFVAERIEGYKMYDTTLLNVYKVLGAKKDDVSIWVNDNIDLFASAWLNGYEIGQEKLYTVEIPDPNNNVWEYTALIRFKNGNVRIVMTNNHDWREDRDYQLTEAEIRKDFDWAWQAGFAKEVW